VSAAALPGLAAAATDWQAVAARSRRNRRLTTALLYAFLVLGSMPILIPYLWLVTVAFSGRTGASTLVLWRTLGVVLPALLLWSILRLSLEEGRRLRRMEIGLGLVTLALVAALTGPYLHVDNWRFLWNPNIADTLKGASGVGAKFPNVWVAFGNSLTLALLQMTLVLVVSTLCGYYLSRYEFPGRANYLRGLLVLHAFPAMTLIIPIFLLMHWIGLLDTLTGVILVIAALELPFAIFVMKGFFDAVPLELEDAARIDGCSRIGAMLRVILPLVVGGLVATAVFVAIGAWNEFLFALTFTLTTEQRTVPVAIALLSGASTYELPWGNIMAASVIVTVPLIVLVLVFQRRIVSGLTAGAVKG